MHTHNHHILTGMLIPRMALETMSTGDMRFTGDAVARLEIGYSTSDLYDLTTVFMPQNHGQRASRLRPRRPSIDMVVGPTDGSSLDPHQQVAWPDFRHIHLQEFQSRFRLRFHHRFHLATLTTHTLTLLSLTLIRISQQHNALDHLIFVGLDKLQRLLNFLKRKSMRHKGIEVHPSGPDQVDSHRINISVPEHALNADT